MKEKFYKLLACMITVFILLNSTPMGMEKYLINDANAYSSTTGGDKQDKENQANKNAAGVHREKAENLISSMKKDQYFSSTDNRDKFEKAYELYHKGIEYESNEQYKDAFQSYHDCWKILLGLGESILSRDLLYQTLLKEPNGDYDCDGLYNVFEMEKLKELVDPLAKDTDEDGTIDSNEDYDQDELTNIQEQQYGTDPTNQDTDGDGLSDGSEIRLGTDPTKTDTNSDGIPDGQEKILQTYVDQNTKIQIDVDSQGDITKSIEIKDFSDEPIFAENTAMVAPIVNISLEGSFNTAKISIPFDLNKVPNGDVNNVKMVYFDEEKLTFVPLESQGIDLQSGIIWGETTHFSLYTLFYVPNWNSIWQVPFNVGERTTETVSKFMDVMFVLDSSGSMSWNDPNDYRKTAAKSFVDALVPGDRVGVVLGDRAGVVDFDNYAKLVQPLTENYEAVKAAIDKIDSIGGTDIGAGVEIANDEIINKSKDDRFKVEILLTDGEGSYSQSLTNEAKNNGIIIYTIGLGSSVDKNLLKSIAESTGGEYFPVESADQLPIVYDRIVDIVTDPNDSDNDGIYDDVETKGMRVGSTYDKMVYTDPNNPDTDGDGLKDGEEIGKPVLLAFNSTQYSYYPMFSNPTLKDTDGELLDDYFEKMVSSTKPLYKDSDSDGLNDKREADLGTNPNNKDTDSDKFNDYKETTDSRLDPKVYDRIIDNKIQYKLTKDETWNGRYHIYTTVNIPSGKMIKAEPGTQVIVYNDKNRIGYYGMAFEVYGYLISSGSENNSVAFKSGITDGLWAEWPGIAIQSGGYGNFENSIIVRANIGIMVSGRNASVRTDNCGIDNTNTGILARDWCSNLDNGSPILTLNNIKMYDKNLTGLYIDGSAKTSINKGYFWKTGIGIAGSPDAKIILNSVNIQNTDIALSVIEYNIYGGPTVDVKQCSFESNEIGIAASHHGTNVNIEDSDISNNSEYGISTKKSALAYCYNVNFSGNGEDIHSSALEEMIKSIVLDFIPGAGDYKGIVESIYGRNILTDEQLSLMDKGLGFVCLAELKDIKNGIRLIKDLKYLKYVDEAITLYNKYGDTIMPYIQKYGDDFVEVYKKCQDRVAAIALKHGDVAAGLMSRHAKEAVDLISKYGDEAIDAYKYSEDLLSGYSKLDDISAFDSDSSKLASKMGLKSFTENNYSDGLKKLFNWKDKKVSDAFQAHHIFPVAYFGKGNRYEYILSNAGVNINDPRLLVWWEKSSHLSNASKYNSEFSSYLNTSQNLSANDVINKARELMKEYDFKVSF